MKTITKMENFGYQYYEFCNNLAKVIRKENLTFEKPELEKRLFGYFVTKPISFDISSIENHDELGGIYRSILSEISNTDKWEFPKIVKNFIYFIKISEKTFFYNNDDGNIIYCEMDKVSGEYKLHITTDDYNILYELQNSSINILDKEILGADNPLSFMNDITSDIQSTVLFANISIKRNYGEHMFTEYKFVQSSPLIFEDPGDNILFDITDKIIRKIISNTFNDILDNTISKVSDLDENIKVEEILNNGTINVWRRRSE